MSQAGNGVSENEYDLTLATEGWSKMGGSAVSGEVEYYDPNDQLQVSTIPQGVKAVTSCEEAIAKPPCVLIVADASKLKDSSVKQLLSYCNGGGRLLLLHPGKALTRFLPNAVTSFRPVKGEIVTFAIPESPVFDGIEPLDLSWFEVHTGKFPYACGGIYQVDRTKSNINTLADYCELHGYLIKREDIYKFTGTPLIEARIGRGVILASEMMTESAPNDPIAQRLLSNMISSLAAPTEEGK